MTALIVLLACSTAGPPPPETPLAPIATAHTTRLSGPDAETQAISVSQALYASMGPATAPRAVVLVPQDVSLAVTALHGIGPLGAPLLYQTPERGLSPRTRIELGRLRPTGLRDDRRTQIYVVGRVQQRVLRTLRDDLGYRVRHFDEDDPVRLAAALARWRGGRPETLEVALDAWDGVAHALAFEPDADRILAWVRRGDAEAGVPPVVPASRFTVGHADNLLGLIPAALLEGPVVLLADGLVSRAARAWIELAPPSAHAWILGTEAQVPWEVQREIDRLIRPSGTLPPRIAETSDGGRHGS